jgi:HD superfamily phosphohydrolase
MSNKTQKYEIRDVIHGLIERSSLEVKIINTPVFQRLRRIHQLALANLVYPCAHHTRFEHSLGTMHIAGRIAEKLKGEGKLSKNDIANIRLTALLHDVGHGPFSHISEYLLEKYYNPELIDIGQEREKIHEIVTRDIIKKDTDLKSLIPDNQRGQVLSLLHKDDLKDFRYDIVSGPLDADKLDYLLRDSYYTGVKYGLYDLDKIIESLRVIRFGPEESYLGIDEEGIYALEQLIMAKYHLTTQVYFHRIRGITDSMIIRGIELAVNEGLDEVKRLFTYDGSNEFLKKYYSYNDENLISLIRKGGGPLSKEIFERLYNRKLFKMVHSRRISEIEGAKLKDIYSNLNLNNTFENDLEKKIAEKLKTKPEFVIIKTVDIKNPFWSPQGYSIKDQTILVKLRDKPDKEAEQIGEIKWSIFNFKGGFGSPEIQVYAPYDFLTDMRGSKRETEKKKLDEIISKILYK